MNLVLTIVSIFGMFLFTGVLLNPIECQTRINISLGAGIDAVTHEEYIKAITPTLEQTRFFKFAIFVVIIIFAIVAIISFINYCKESESNE